MAALDERGIVSLEMPETTDAGIEEPVSVTSKVESLKSNANMTDVMVIEVPAEGFTDLAYENLSKLVAGKATLIRKAAADCIADGVETLPVARDDEKIYFPWFRFEMKSDEVEAWSCFVRALCSVARKQRRVLLKEKPLEDGASEKFAMRCYLLKLGFIGDEYKTIRKIILTGLPGSGSHKWDRRDKARNVRYD